MKLTKSNCYIEKHNGAYVICISVPDGSRNFIHCEEMKLREAIRWRNRLVLEFTYHLAPIHATIREDEEYFRIHVSFFIYKKNVSPNELEMSLSFHSRKLNLVDAQHEYDLLTEVDF